MSLEHAYTDLRGLKIHDDVIASALERCKLTEQGILELMGDRMLLPGFMSHFLQSFEAQTRWVESVNVH